MHFAPVVEELTFAHGPDRLVGDLYRPPWAGPHPAVVFVEGSGPGGRDLGDWPLRLAAAGFASLAYDKPGSGASTGDWTRQSLADRASETTAAVAALRTRADLAADRIALIGGSQGGWVAHLAAGSSGVAAVVTVSGPGVGVLAQERYRLRRQLPARGFGERDVDRALALMTEQVERVRAGEDPAVVHADQAPWRDAGWYPLLAGTTPGSIAFLAGIADYEPSTALASLTCPLLAIFGAEDVQVPVEDSVRAIEAALPTALRQTVVFPGAGHSLRLGTGERAPGFDELIAGWLYRTLATTATAATTPTTPTTAATTAG
jgi:pimeloyl-ACP methyl ester carboxylesterase